MKAAEDSGKETEPARTPTGKRVPEPARVPLTKPLPKPETETTETGTAISEEDRALLLHERGEVEQEVLEIAARDTQRSSRDEDLLAKNKAEKGETFYSDLIYTLAHLRYEEPDARVLWVNLLSHKWEMSERLGRNVGIRVAALDYFRNIIGALENVKIMEASTYIETAQLAVTDGLTGVFNHRHFQDRLLRDIARAEDESRPLCLLMFDLDHFKTYNDLNGHVAGDVALKEVASAMRRNLKKDDLVARYGGEEFVVILYGLDKRRGKHVADRTRKVIRDIDFPNEQVLPRGNLTVSVGVAAYPEDAVERGELIARADRALYLAKQRGRNRVVMAPKEQRAYKRRSTAAEITVVPADGEEGKISAELVNVSTGGMRLHCDRPLAVGRLLRFNLPSLPKGETLFGRIVWQMVQPDGRTQVGVKFVNVGPGLKKTLFRLLAKL